MPYGKPNPMTQLAPKAPSTLIKASRWLALGLGVLYGSSRLAYLKRKEEGIQKEENIIREFLAAKKAKIHEENSLAEMINLKKDIEK